MNKTLITNALLISLLATSSAANATSYKLYNVDNNFRGDGSELVDALLEQDDTINVVAGSSRFQGRFEPSEEFNFSAQNDGNQQSNPTYGSASIYQDLDFGSANGVSYSMDDGILLSSGFAGPADSNTHDSFSSFASLQGDDGLDALLATQSGNHSSQDATVLSFDFTVESGINAISLDFMFGSEEYSESANQYPEIAAVFVDGVNYAGFNSGALLTLTGYHINDNNFFNNDIHNFPNLSETLNTEYDGITKPLTLTGLLDASKTTHNIKIAIADTNDFSTDSGLYVANLQGIKLAGSDANNPLLPGSTNNNGFEFVIDVGDAGIGIDPNRPIFIDPYVATGYTYSTNGKFASVVIPKTYGDGKYNLSVWDGSKYIFLSELTTGDSFDFLSLYPNGVSLFKIDGIELGAGLDPQDANAFVTGITFTNSGTFTVNQNPIKTCDGSPDCASTSVPETASWLLLLAGLLGFRLFNKKA